MIRHCKGQCSFEGLFSYEGEMTGSQVLELFKIALAVDTEATGLDWDLGNDATDILFFSSLMYL